MRRQAIEIPLVYSCSGCSSAAQLANTLAIKLHRDGEAQMSCIAGVGGDVPNFVHQATSGRPILGLDGCPLACVRNCLKRHGVEPDHHIQLQDHGVEKVEGQDASDEDMKNLYPQMVALAKKLHSNYIQPSARTASSYSLR